MTAPTPDAQPVPSGPDGSPIDLPKALTPAGVPLDVAGRAAPVPMPPDSEPARADQPVDLTHMSGHLTYARQLHDQIEELRRQLKPLMETIKAAVGSADVVLVDGKPVATWRSHEQTRIVPALVRAQTDPITVASCTEKVTSRTWSWS